MTQFANDLGRVSHLDSIAPASYTTDQGNHRRTTAQPTVRHAVGIGKITT